MLDLIWKASFKIDESASYEICQYNEKGKEILFKEVLDNQENLEWFALLNQRTKNIYYVDLKKGSISIGKQGKSFLKPRADMLRKDKYEYRLIYFREVQLDFNSIMQQVGDKKVIYFLGFQYIDENKKNHKRIMKIHSDGRLVIN